MIPEGALDETRRWADRQVREHAHDQARPEMEVNRTHEHLRGLNQFRAVHQSSWDARSHGYRVGFRCHRSFRARRHERSRWRDTAAPLDMDWADGSPGSLNGRVSSYAVAEAAEHPWRSERPPAVSVSLACGTVFSLSRAHRSG